MSDSFIKNNNNNYTYNHYKNRLKECFIVHQISHVCAPIEYAEGLQQAAPAFSPITSAGPPRNSWPFENVRVVWPPKKALYPLSSHWAMRGKHRMWKMKKLKPNRKCEEQTMWNLDIREMPWKAKVWNFRINFSLQPRRRPEAKTRLVPAVGLSHINWAKNYMTPIFLYTMEQGVTSTATSHIT